MKVSRFGWNSRGSAGFSLPTGRSGQILALGLVALVVGMVWVAAVRPLLSLYAARTDAVARQQALAGEMAGWLRHLPELEQRALAAAANGPPAGAMLAGATDAVAGANLQQRVQDLAAEAGVSLSSTEVLGTEQIGAYRLIGLRIGIAAPWTVLVHLLQTFEQTQPTIMVDDLQLRGPRLLLANSDPPVEATMTVLALKAGSTPEAAR